MSIGIVKRNLKNEETKLLIKEIQKFPNLISPSENQWNKFNCIYVVATNNNLIGVCVVIKLKEWIKLGPFVILEKYQGKGFGKKIIDKIMDDYPNNNFFIGSRTPAVWKIAEKLGFKKTNNVWQLPNELKKYFIKYLIESVNVKYLKEFFRKSLIRKEKYRCYLKNSIFCRKEIV